MKKALITHCFSLAVVSSHAATLSFDEAAQMTDLGAPTAPTLLTFGVGANTISGQVDTGNGDTRDAFTFTLTAGQSLESVILLGYDNPNTAALNDGNTGFFHFDDGAISVVPSGNNGASLLGGDTFGPSQIGSNLLNESNPGVGGGSSTGVLGPGTYTFNIQNTSTISTYELEFNVVPEPSATALLGLGSMFLAMRRRRA